MARQERDALSPFSRRLLWLIQNGEAGRALVALDLVLCRHAIPLRSTHGVDGFRRFVLPDLDGGGPVAPEDFPARARAFMERCVQRGSWRDGNAIAARSPWEKLLPWVYRLVKRDLSQQESEAFLAHRERIADWFISQRPDMTDIRLNQAVRRSFVWHRRTNERRDARSLCGRVVARLEMPAPEDGELLVYRLRPEHLNAEGKAMQHCADNADCYGWVRDGVARFYSVWQLGSGVTDQPTRLFTLDVTGDGKQLVQFRSYFNAAPFDSAPEWMVKRVVDWLESIGVRTRCPDLRRNVRLPPKELARIIKDCRTRDGAKAVLPSELF